MCEERTSVLRRNMLQRLRYGLLQNLTCSGSRTAQLLLDLGKRQLNWREVRRVGRQVPQSATTGRHQLLQTQALVRTQVVEQNNLARTQGWPQDMRDIGLEKRCGHATNRHQAWSHPVERERCNGRGVGRGVAGKRGDGPFATGGAGIARGHIQVRAKLIDHDDIGWVNVLLLDQKANTVPPIALGSDQRLFLRVNPRRRIARPSVHWLMLVPCSAFQRAVCSASVASGTAATWARTASSWADGMVGATPPEAGRGEASPVSRRAASQRLRLARLTWKVVTTEVRGVPRSRAASTRSRKSVE